MKIWFKRLHLIFALIAGLFLINISLSSSLLVFGKDIQQLWHPKQWTISQSAQPVDLTRTLTGILAQAENNNRSITQITISNRSEWPWEIQLTNGEQWNVDPNNGDIIHRYQQGEDFYNWCPRWHRWLWIDNKTFKPWARHLISGVSLVLILEVILGYLLWSIPRRGMLKRLRLRPGRDWRTRFHQYHLLIGVLFGVPLLLVAFTGLSFNWPTQSIFETVTSSTMAIRANNKAATVGGLDQLEVSLHKAQQALPNASIRRIYFPKNAMDPLQVRMQYAGEEASFSYIWIDAGNAEILTLYDSAEAPVANDWWDFKYAFHVGLWLGSITQWLWLLIALLPAAFTLSGGYLYYKRCVQKRQ